MAFRPGWIEDEYDEFPIDEPKPTFEVTFVDTELAQTFDCGICLDKIKNAVAVCDDQLISL